MTRAKHLSEAGLKRAVSGFIDYFGWLSESLLLIDGWTDQPLPATPNAVRNVGGRPLSVVAYVGYQRSDLPESARGFALAVRSSADLQPTDLQIVTTDRAIRLPVSATDQIARNVAKRIFELRSMLPAGGWAEFKNFIQNAALGSEQLDQISTVTRLAMTSNHKDYLAFRGTFLKSIPILDLCIRLDDDLYAMLGWIAIGNRDIAELNVIGPSRQTIPIADQCVWYNRPDVDEHLGIGKGADAGFAAIVHVPQSRHTTELRLELVTKTGFDVMVKKAVYDDDPSESRRQILSSFARTPNAEILSRYLKPSLERLQPKISSQTEVEQILSVRSPNDSPISSVIVPVYKGLDYVTQQIIEFSADPAMRRHELIYVLDSPAERTQFKRSMLELADLYDVSFKLILMKRNVGFSAANNVAAHHSKGRYLLLLNQDVIPVRAGWVDRMIEHHRRLEDVGAVGCKLLYEDDSIQHAGLFFGSVPADPDVWHNMHYYKGLHRHFPEASISREVPAVTAACMLVARELYLDLGGLDEAYVHGDFEDSDFCLKCRQKGLRNYYLGDVELYHLERQSFDSLDSEPWRKTAQHYNLWLQNQRWAPFIREHFANDPD